MLDLARRLAALLPVLLLACAGDSSTASPAAAPPAAGWGSSGSARSVRGEYLVTLAPDAGEGVIAQRLGSFGIERIQSLGQNVFLVAFGTDPGLEALEKARAGESRITAIQPNFAYRTN